VTIVNIKYHVTTGYRELMRDPSVMAAMREILDRVQEKAGEGFESELEPESGKRRVPRGAVFTATYEARRRQARDHVLEQALDI
jgi:hypothetical protein